MDPHTKLTALTDSRNYSNQLHVPLRSMTLERSGGAGGGKGEWGDDLTRVRCIQGNAFSPNISWKEDFCTKGGPKTH